MAKVRARILISGRVQGVFYRASAEEEAERLGLSGWVRNLIGGEVEAEAEGERSAIEDFIAWCRRGPPLARVEAVDVEWKPYRGELRGFRITH